MKSVSKSFYVQNGVDEVHLFPTTTDVRVIGSCCHKYGVHKLKLL